MVKQSDIAHNPDHVKRAVWATYFQRVSRDPSSTQPLFTVPRIMVLIPQNGIEVFKASVKMTFYPTKHYRGYKTCAQKFSTSLSNHEVSP